jgi:hypothetical protein
MIELRAGDHATIQSCYAGEKLAFALMQFDLGTPVPEV